MQHSRTPTNWYVITGGPGSGKTTIINLLKERGYKTTMEHARHYIDTERVTGKTVEEIKRNQIEFQQSVFKMQMAQEQKLDPDEIVFLDRAIPDALAYYRFLTLPEDENLQHALSHVFYKKIFILDLLPLVNDYARTEDKIGQQRIHQLLIEAYKSLGFPIVHVPVMPPEERVAFILKNL